MNRISVLSFYSVGTPPPSSRRIAHPGLFHARHLLPVISLLCAPILTHAESRKPAGPDVLIVSDVPADQTTVTRPTADKPVHYIFLGGLERPLGQAIGGEPIPGRAEVQKEIGAALASQGYLPTQVGGPKPSLVIVFSYGTANLVTDEIAGLDSEPSTLVAYNSREIFQLVGADKASQHLMLSTEADRINDAARNDRLYVFVAALDAVALAKKERKLVWRTRISIELRRHTLSDSLHVMLTSAAPYFGSTTELPVFLDDADRRKASVKIGPLKVLDDNVKHPPTAPPMNK
ncbi:MAG: hypothetical protein PHU85_20030 [Phycisphaerae bacterium]|nr:hypothetical protein [Phycisphaerae bacterium]